MSSGRPGTALSGPVYRDVVPPPVPCSVDWLHDATTRPTASSTVTVRRGLPGRRRGPARRPGVRRAARLHPAGQGLRARPARCGTRPRLASLAAHELRTSSCSASGSRSSGPSRRTRWRPSSRPIDAFHDRTAPSDWLEGLVKAYVGDGIAQDFYREIANYVDGDTRALVLGVLEDAGPGRLRDIGGAPGHRGRRPSGGPARAVGAAARGRGAHARRSAVAVERDALGSLLVGAPGSGGADLAELGRMFVRLTD